MQTWSEKLQSEGRREGRREGRAEGARGVVRTVLEGRFGSLPAGTLQRLETVDDVAELERPAARALGAATLGELDLAG